MFYETMFVYMFVRPQALTQRMNITLGYLCGNFTASKYKCVSLSFKSLILGQTDFNKRESTAMTLCFKHLP